jgi:hypothetical protein
MVKKKSKNKPSTLVIVATLSLAINGLMLVALIVGSVLEETGKFDFAIVKEGTTILCSDRYRQDVITSGEKKGESINQKGLDLVAIDYPCEHNGASDYYTAGQNSYISSLGLKNE